MQEAWLRAECLFLPANNHLRLHLATNVALYRVLPMRCNCSLDFPDLFPGC